MPIIFYQKHFFKFSLLKNILTFALRVCSICLVLSALSYIVKQFFRGVFALIFRFDSKTVLKSWTADQIFKYFRYSLALLQKTKKSSDIEAIFLVFCRSLRLYRKDLKILFQFQFFSSEKYIQYPGIYI